MITPVRRPWLRPDYTKAALIDGPYRYWLTRRWAPAPPLVLFGGNPSTADADTDDATIRRGCDFADLSGHGGLTMLNPYAWRDRDVRALRSAVDPVGPDNDGHILAHAVGGGTVVVGWGPPTKVPLALRPRLREVCELLLQAGVSLHVLRLTAEGHPEHPLMLPRSCRPALWRTP